MTPPDPTRKLQSLLKRLRSQHAQDPAQPQPDTCPDDPEAVLQQFILSFLIWEASPAKAVAAMRRINQGVVDYNELRVFLVDELVAILGERYPRAEERAERLRSALHDLYNREHAVTLGSVVTLPKRDVRAYLNSLEGVPPFVAARVVLLSLGGHAVPIDERLRQLLVEEEAIDPELDPAEASAWLERQLRAGEAAEVYALLEAWCAESNGRAAAKKA